MVKYNIVNKETNQIICKPKSGLANLIFEYNNFVGALTKVKELCQEVDDEE